MITISHFNALNKRNHNYKFCSFHFGVFLPLVHRRNRYYFMYLSSENGSPCSHCVGFCTFCCKFQTNQKLNEMKIFTDKKRIFRYLHVIFPHFFPFLKNLLVSFHEILKLLGALLIFSLEHFFFSLNRALISDDDGGRISSLH